MIFAMEGNTINNKIQNISLFVSIEVVLGKLRAKQMITVHQYPYFFLRISVVSFNKFSKF